MSFDLLTLGAVVFALVLIGLALTVMELEK